MSDLQFSLVVIGVTIIGGVVLYNWVQERNYRKRLDQAFGNAPEDVLLPGGSASRAQAGRSEPAAPAPARTDAAGSTPSREPPTLAHAAADPDDLLECVAEIDAAAGATDQAVDELLGKLVACGKPVRVLGLTGDPGTWVEVARGRGGRYRRLKAALQLVNRSGTVNAAQLGIFCDALRTCAEKLKGQALLPDVQGVLKAAQDLDAFCGGVDLAIGVNIVAQEGAPFAGARIRELAEAAGFALEPDGVFHFRGGQRRTLFTLDNQQSAPFLPERLASLTTPGITLTLDVPRVADGPAVLDRMLAVAHELATGLGGRLVDDNRAPLTEAGITRIREQLKAIDAALSVRGIAAGGERALRLFS